jgi:hypothetical protein
MRFFASASRDLGDDAPTYYFDLSSFDLEFRRFLADSLSQLAWHLDNTEEADLGNEDEMREVLQLGILPFLLTTKEPDWETRRNFRRNRIQGLLQSDS